MTFTLFDIFILTTISISSLLGLYKGMVHITINLLGFIASIIVAVFLYSYVYILFSDYINNKVIASIISGIMSYVMSLIFFTSLSSKILLLCEGSSKGFIDRLFGLILGIIRGGLFSLVIFVIIAIFTSGTYSDAKNSKDIIQNLSVENYPEWLQNSGATPHLEKILKESVLIIPDGVWDLIPMPDKSKKDGENIIETINELNNTEKSSKEELIKNEE